jgi:hypothetical protein
MNVERWMLMDKAEREGVQKDDEEIGDSAAGWAWERSSV